MVLFGESVVLLLSIKHLKIMVRILNVPSTRILNSNYRHDLKNSFKKWFFISTRLNGTITYDAHEC